MRNAIDKFGSAVAVASTRRSIPCCGTCATSAASSRSSSAPSATKGRLLLGFRFSFVFLTEFFFGVQVQAPQRPTAAPAQDPQRRVDQLRRRRRRHGDLDADADGDADAAGGGTASSAASAASSAASSAAAAASAAAADPVRPRPPPRAAAGLFTAPAPPAEPAPPPPPPPLELELTVPCRANRDPGPDLPVTHPTTSTTRAQGTDTLTPIVTMIGTLI